MHSLWWYVKECYLGAWVAFLFFCSDLYAPFQSCSLSVSFRVLCRVHSWSFCFSPSLHLCSLTLSVSARCFGVCGRRARTVCESDPRGWLCLLHIVDPDGTRRVRGTAYFLHDPCGADCFVSPCCFQESCSLSFILSVSVVNVHGERK